MSERNNILIIGAHLDDIEIGVAGTAMRSIQQQNSDVYGLVVCKGNTPNRLVDATDSKLRVFNDNMKEIGMKDWKCLECDDQEISAVSYNVLAAQIQDYIYEVSADVVYVNNSDDINIDHRIVSDITRVATRPRSSCPVRALYEYYIPGSSDWNFTSHDQRFNVAVDITEYFKKKLELVSRYTSEIRTGFDPLTLSNISNISEYYGSIFGFDKAEVFKLIYMREI